jgi:hypothetical protein
VLQAHYQNNHTPNSENFLKIVNSLSNYLFSTTDNTLKLQSTLTPIGLTIQNFYLTDMILAYQQLLNGPSEAGGLDYYLELNKRKELAVKWEVLVNG